MLCPAHRGRRKSHFRGVGEASIGIYLTWQGKSATRLPKRSYQAGFTSYSKENPTLVKWMSTKVGFAALALGPGRAISADSYV
jgi:hypothetical protein